MGDVGWGESSLCRMKGKGKGEGRDRAQVFPLINDVRRGRPGGQKSRFGDDFAPWDRESNDVNQVMEKQFNLFL